MTDTHRFAINSVDLAKALRTLRVPHTISYPLIIVKQLQQHTTARGLFTTHLIVDLQSPYQPRYFKVTTSRGSDGNTMLDTPEISLTRTAIMVNNDPCCNQILMVPEVSTTVSVDIDV